MSIETYRPRLQVLRAAQFDGSAASVEEIRSLLPAGMTLTWPPMGEYDGVLILHTPGRHDRVVRDGMWVSEVGGQVITHGAVTFGLLYERAGQ